MLLLANPTTISRCVRAAEFKQASRYRPPVNGDLTTIHSGLWLVLGKTSPWADEQFPSEPAVSLKRVAEEKAFWYVPAPKLIFPHRTGTISTDRGNYLPVDTLDPNLLAEAAVTTVLVEPALLSSTLEDGVNYRMCGLCSDLKFSALPSSDALNSGEPMPATQVNSYTLLWAAAFKKFNKLDADVLSFQVFVDF